MLSLHTYALSISVVLFGCDAYQEVHKQLPAFANLKNTALEIQDVIDEQGSITNSEALRIVRKRHKDGLDSWGSPIVFKATKKPRFSFILISFGRDRKLDVDHVDQYFTHIQEDTAGDYDRDIVFRDGKPVTLTTRK